MSGIAIPCTGSSRRAARREGYSVLCVLCIPCVLLCRDVGVGVRAELRYVLCAMHYALALRCADVCGHMWPLPYTLRHCKFGELAEACFTLLMATFCPTRYLVQPLCPSEVSTLFDCVSVQR